MGTSNIRYPSMKTLRMSHLLTLTLCMSWTGVPSWAFSIPWEERLVDFGGYKTWVREVGRKEGGGGGFLGLFGKGSDKSKGCALAP